MTDEKIEIRRMGGGWYYIHNVVAREYLPLIGVSAFCLYNVLASYADSRQEAWPSYRTISRLIGVSYSTIKRDVDTLEKWKLIRVRRGNGRGHVSRYTLLTPKDIKKDKKEAVKNLLKDVLKTK